jgi:acyl transferase domain-containing protein/NAD(P)H-dependent flavin oxidoreductase YrpB (nitropropane dioxygenase family)/NAD(P)-dependent dehydrogenase (short-subunit alcohol dehydrogenase family)
MEPCNVIVLTPPGAIEPSLAIAASRAGAIGILDLEFAKDYDQASSAIDRLSRFTGNRFGLQIRPDFSDLDSLLSTTAKPCVVILTCADSFSAECVRKLQAASIDVLLEATSVTEAILGAELGVDGIVLKGHEAGGRVGADTSFVLVQKWCQYSRRHELRLPFWVRGGIGPCTAAACLSAGARGVVLDSQVLLARESQLTESAKKRISGLDGSETVPLGSRLGETYRVYARADSPAYQELSRDEERLNALDWPYDQKREVWRNTIQSQASEDPTRGVWLVGQDIAIAASLAERGVTVAGIVQSICETASKQLDSVRRLMHLAEGSPLAKSHGTRYPILQGPMTRVSDTAAFANAVAKGGALPFLALALLRKSETEELLEQAKSKLGNRPWGVGILGFVPPEIRGEQLEAIRLHKPPFAIIAGGRPDQAKELESQGIVAYLHVPSPGLLRRFLKEGARRFIFEGQECGGHIGPRASFALWETMIDAVTDFLDGKPGSDLHVVFAGGIHDGLSSRMVAALSAGLAEKGVKVGILLGTAYLFTQEAVVCDAITERFQKEAIACGETVLLETGPGHAIRCIPTPYAGTFETEKLKLKSEGKSPLEIGIALERMNLGRLRVASKGLDRQGTIDAKQEPVERRPGNGIGLVSVSEDDQYNRGMYMIGQVAALRSEVTTIDELHASVCGDNALATSSQTVVAQEGSPPEPAPPPCDVAIIGLSCFYPKAGSSRTYWENILAKVNGVIEIPPTHWDWKLYYDPDPRARDKIVSKWGGFMDDILFDPLWFGITPKSIPCIEPLQLLLLEAVRQGIADAGYTDRPFPRERTAAILGVGGGGMPLSVAYGFRACMPLLDTIPNVPIKSSQVVELGDGILPEWTEDSFPGILLNVAAGRVANRFNLGGPNMAIDAACGSSLAALYAGVRELNDRTSDVAVVMGADAVQTPYAYVAFSKTHALSPKGRCRPFDAAADGIVLAEGIGVAVLKRLADAERDGDRIYAVIKGVGASSDGRDKGLTAPRAEGQLRALNRAYAQARISPSRLGLVEAHGTGTVVGDQTEARALGQVFLEAGGPPQSCALGSVKSMIGHSKCAAGLAGLIKTSFALHHKVLPPTLVETPNAKGNFDSGPLYLNTEARPWVNGANHPRTAGVSAFGFGGTNFHTVLEEYTGDFLNQSTAGFRRWPAELLVWRRPDKPAILESLKRCQDALIAGAKPELSDLAASVWNSSRTGNGQPTLAIVVTSIDDLKEKLALAREILAKADETISDPRGIYFAAKPENKAGKIAFLFPGQGSQYPDMLAQQAMAFSEVREVLDRAERTLNEQLEKPLGRYIYPPSAFTPEQEQQNRKELQDTEVAQPAVGATSLGMAKLLESFGIEADFLAGHSYGEYAALASAGALSEDNFIVLSHQRGRAIKEAAAKATGGMVAVDAPASAVEPMLSNIAEVWIANHNSPHQTVIAGTEQGLTAATTKLQAGGLRSQRIPVSCGFHTPLIASAKEPLERALAAAQFSVPRKPVFSNTTSNPHSMDPAGIARQLAEHLVSPVRFADEISAMHDAGARVFIEVGPQAVLTGLTSQILNGKPHLAIASDLKTRPGLVQLAHLLGQLIVAGVPAQLDRLFQGRNIQAFDLGKLDPETGKPKLTPTMWVINGVRSRPLNGPEPRLLGHPLPSSPSATKGTDISAPKPSKPVVPSAVPRAASTNGSAIPTKPTAVPTVSNRPQSPVTPTTTKPEKMTHTDTPASMGSASAPEGAAQVMMRFQEVMSRFLETQRSVMLTFLGSSGNNMPAPGRNGHAGTNGHAAPYTLPSTPPAVVNRLPASEPQAKAAAIPTPPRNGDHSHLPQAPVEANGKHAPAAVQQTKEASSKKGPPDRDALLAQLLDLVSDRTGYPKEALSIDLDLEADLGIDSIKRVEILGSLAETLEAGEGGTQPNLEMEKLSVIKTLRGIADYVSAAIAEPIPQPSSNGTHSKPETSSKHPGARQGDVQRLVVRLIDVPLPLRPRFSPPNGTILLTDDGLGCARDLADRLGELDVNTALIRMADGKQIPNGAFACDLTNPDEVSDLLSRIREKCGRVAGLIHLLPLAESPEGQTTEQRCRREVISLYLLARGLESELRESGKSGGSVLLAVTALGGKLGFGDDLPADISVGHGGVAGFTKSLGHEWPEVTVRVVDIDGETPATQLTELLMGELGDPDGPFEVGRTRDRRVTWQCEPGPVDKDSSALTITKDDTILLTGGARGITAKVALELAKRFQPRLVLIGSSPAPQVEVSETANLTRAADLKAALMKTLQADGKPAAPAIVEAAYKRLLKDREIRANLEAIRKAGSRVDYRAVDVRDAVAFGSLIDELKADGGIAGVIHGAGVIEDKLLRDKTPESFDRVFGTKVDSALTLARKLDPEKLKFFELFASITSRYGNRGQSDYAAANEVLSKLASDLDRKWPGRVVSIAWGPWAEVGMVAELEKHLVARGLKLIEPVLGAGFAVDEVVYGNKGEAEILVAGGTEQPARPSRNGSGEVIATATGVS